MSSRGSGPLQLSGMTEMSVTNGVAVWRPLLSHNKDAIYDFAHRYVICIIYRSYTIRDCL